MFTRHYTKLETHLGLSVGTIEIYVLVEQLAATYQLMEIRAVRNIAQDEERTRKLLPKLRKVLEDSVTIYADANSSYTVEEGISIGKFLEETRHYL